MFQTLSDENGISCGRRVEASVLAATAAAMPDVRLSPDTLQVSNHADKRRLMTVRMQAFISRANADLGCAALFLLGCGRSDGGDPSGIPVLLECAMEMIGEASGNEARTVGEAKQWTKTVRRGQASEVKPRY
jgi:hypothetical protein